VAARVRYGGSRAPNSARHAERLLDAEAPLVESVQRLDAQAVAAGIYGTINPVRHDLLARRKNRLGDYARDTTQDSHILRRVRLLVDLDADRPSGISATDEEHDAALTRAQETRVFLGERSWPAPIYVDSGNGAHLLYAIDLPNDSNATKLVQSVLKALSQRFSDSRVKVDESVFNAARIVKIPGTMARKGDNVPDRPHRRSQVLDMPADFGREVVTEALLVAIVTELTPKAEHAKHHTNGATTFDLDAFIARNFHVKRGPEAHDGGERWIVACPFNADHGGTSAAILRMPSGAIVFKCQHNGCRDQRWANVRERFDPGYHETREQGHEPATPRALPHGLDLDPKRVRNGSENAVVVQRRALRVVDACDVRMVRPEWLEPGRIPLGTLTIFDGLGGIGKTTFAFTIIARATVGRTLFDDTRRDPMNALVIAEEDDLGVLRAKLAVAGADLARVRFVDASVLADDVGSVRLPRDVAALRELTEQVGVPVVYIDALFSHLELDGEGKMAHQMRAAIAPIARLARETGAAVMATRHWSKGAKSAADRGLGSGELSNVARSVLSFGKHPDSRDGDQRFVLATTKSNWSAKAPSIEYHLESVEVLDDNGSRWSVPRVVVRGVATGISADDLAMAGPQDAEERDRLSEAQDVILEALSEGELSAGELEKRVLGNDVAPVTFRRARAKLRANGGISREGGGVAGQVRWSVALPTPAHRGPLKLTLNDEPEWQGMSRSEDRPPNDMASQGLEMSDNVEDWDV